MIAIYGYLGVCYFYHCVERVVIVITVFYAPLKLHANSNVIWK